MSNRRRLRRREVYYEEPDGTWDKRPGTHANSGFMRPSGRVVVCTAERAPHLATVLAPSQRRLTPRDAVHDGLRLTCHNGERDGGRVVAVEVVRRVRAVAGEWRRGSAFDMFLRPAVTPAERPVRAGVSAHLTAPGYATLVLNDRRRSCELGRSQRAGYRLSSPSISAIHCTLTLDFPGCPTLPGPSGAWSESGARLIMTDTSTNGTFVDGCLVRRGESRELHDRSIIQFPETSDGPPRFSVALRFRPPPLTIPRRPRPRPCTAPVSRNTEAGPVRPTTAQTALAGSCGGVRAGGQTQRDGHLKMATTYRAAYAQQPHQQPMPPRVDSAQPAGVIIPREAAHRIDANVEHERQIKLRLLQARSPSCCLACSYIRLSDGKSCARLAGYY